MKYIKYILTIIATLILLTFMILKLYFHYDIPKYSGSQPLMGLQDTVEVFTDSYGVPHLFAKNNEDLFLAAGYIIARERLFQLSLLAAMARGEISTLLGESYVLHDDYIKQNKLFSANRDSLSTINYENELLIQAYCSGINTWIDETKEMLPPSFKLLNAKPIKWTVSDVVSTIIMTTSNLHQNKQASRFINTIEQYFGEAKLLEMLATDMFNQINSKKNFSIDSINIADLDLENQILDLIGAAGSLYGSDAMIIPKEQIVTRKPILIFQDANGMRQPAKWYDIHLKGGDFNVEGAVIPGFPIPLVGKTDYAAWAFTGQLVDGAINALFDVANGNYVFDQNNIFDLSLSYADTSGFFRDQKKYSQRLEPLKNSIRDLDNIYLDDFVNILSETKNPEKAKNVHRIAKIYLDNNLANKAYLKMIHEWDGDESAMSEETLLIKIIYKKLLKNVFMDELSLVGEEMFDDFTRLPILAEQSINMILNNNESSWIDDIKTTDYQENLVELVTRSVDEALVEIEKDFGKNPLNWQWGNTNFKTYKHILDERSIIAKLFNLNVGPFGGYGSVSNINFSEYTYDNTYNQISGASIRRIFDLSDMSTSYSILPTGQSGLPKNAHYADQAEMFNKYNFRKIEYDETAMRNSDQYQKLVLCPAG